MGLTGLTYSGDVVCHNLCVGLDHIPDIRGPSHITTYPWMFLPEQKPLQCSNNVRPLLPKGFAGSRYREWIGNRLANVGVSTGNFSRALRIARYVAGTIPIASISVFEAKPIPYPEAISLICSAHNSRFSRGHHFRIPHTAEYSAQLGIHRQNDSSSSHRSCQGASASLVYSSHKKMAGLPKFNFIG